VDDDGFAIPERIPVFPVLDALDDGVLLLYPDFTIAWLNVSLAEILHIRRDDVLGASAPEVLGSSPAGLAASPQEAGELLASLCGAAPPRLEVRIRAPNGEERWYACSSRCLSGDEGEVRMLRFCEMAGHGAERTLQERKDGCRQLETVLNEGIWAIDRDGYTTFANPQMAEILGYDVIEMIGRHFSSFMDGHQADLAREALRRLSAGMREQFELEHIRRDGSRVPTLMAASPIVDAGGRYEGSLACVLEITDRTRMERELLAKTDALDNRVRELDTLYRISRLIGTDAVVLEDLVRGTAELLPGGFRRPDCVCIRIAAGGILHASGGFLEIPWSIGADIAVAGRVEGRIEVGYRGAPPEGDPFLAEERHLISAVAEMLARAVHRSRVERALRESEEKYRLLFERMLEEFYLYEIVRDGDGSPIDFRYLEINARAGRAVGRSREEIAGKSVFEVYPALPGPWEDLFSTVAETGEPVHTEMHTPSQRRYVDLMAYRPQYSRLAVIAYDITRRKHAEEEIQMRNRQLSVLNQIISVSASSLSLDALLEASLAKTLEQLDLDLGLVFMIDADRKQAVLRYHQGVPDSCLTRLRAFRIHHWPRNVVFVAGQPQYLGRDHDDPALLDLEVSSLAMIPLVAESVVVGALYAGSRRKEAFSQEERALLEAIGREIGSGVLRGMLQRSLEAANREANLYLDIMAHDIKNADNVALLYSDLLVDMLEGEAAGYAQRLRGSIEKSTGIIKSVSTIRRIRQGSAQLAPVALDAVVREEVGRFPNADIAYEGCTAVVEADDLLPEVFSNLIGNAAKFGGPETLIGIRVEEYDGEDDAVLVTVEDTGPGVPDELKESIFHRFERGRQPGGGEGLGLYIVRMLVTRYGGRIWVEDRVEGRPDLGAAFRFTLKRAGSTFEEDPA